jgi:oligoendopeptidase F
MANPYILQRHFLPQDFRFNSWDVLAPYFNDLLARKLESADDLRGLLRDASELEAVIEEDAGWRYIRMSTDTNSEEKLQHYTRFIEEIQPKIEPVSNQLNQKITECPFAAHLTDSGYAIYLRQLRTSIELYRDENVPLEAEIRKESQRYGAISGAWTVEWEGKEITLQRAALELKKQDRANREKAWRLINDRRLTDAAALNELYDKLVGLRHQVAVNAGFANYRDYKFRELGRFDYSVQDCLDFHSSIETEILPLVKDEVLEHKRKLGYPELRPWDMDVDAEGRDPLKPFEGGDALAAGTIAAFGAIRPMYGNLITTMQQNGHLDLDSRPGKMPGGYNYPLYESGIPFIFMNSVGSQGDLVTMFHEGGHAIQSFLDRNLELTAFKGLPSEVAELASMSMELISMDQWHVFYKNEADLVRAKKDQLEKILNILPWIAQVDAYQHWVYENHGTGIEARNQAWMTLSQRFGTGVTDWSGLEQYRPTAWHRQLHLFEVPFYYIEYGMAQLGAIAVWRNYRLDPKQALDQYEAALSLGYTRSIPHVYETAGVKFDFSPSYVRELVAFVRSELEKMS